MPETATARHAAPASPGEQNGNGAAATGLDPLAAGILAEVGRQGYTETSVEDVLRVSGVSRGSFYKGYANKLDCFLAAWEAGMTALGLRLAAASSGAGPWSSRVRTALVELVVFAEEDPAAARALLVEANAAGPEAQSRRLELTRGAAVVLRSGFPGSAGDDGPDFVALGVVGAIEMALQTRLSRGAASELREVMPDLIQFALAPYVSAKTAEQERRWAQRDCSALPAPDH